MFGSVQKIHFLRQYLQKFFNIFNFNWYFNEALLFFLAIIFILLFIFLIVSFFTIINCPFNGFILFFILLLVFCFSMIISNPFIHHHKIDKAIQEDYLIFKLKVVFFSLLNIIYILFYSFFWRFNQSHFLFSLLNRLMHLFVLKLALLIINIPHSTLLSQFSYSFGVIFFGAVKK